MIVFREPRQRPLPWQERKRQIPAWSRPFFALEWVWEWISFLLSKWTFIEVVEYVYTLSILAAVFFYFQESGNRVKQRHYQAWQVINTAQGKGGSGGRIEALQELNNDGVPLVGVDVSGAFLQTVRLRSAHLRRSNFSASDVRNADFTDADLQDSDLHSANFRQANFQRASLAGARLDDADLEGADFTDADFSNAVLDDANLRLVSLNRSNWKAIRSIKGANVFGLRSAPADFLDWALKHGAIQKQSEEQGEHSP